MSPDPSQVRFVQREEPLQLLSGRLPQETTVRNGLLMGGGTPPAPPVAIATSPTGCPKTNEHVVAAASLAPNLVPVLVSEATSLARARCPAISHLGLSKLQGWRGRVVSRYTPRKGNQYET